MGRTAGLRRAVTASVALHVVAAAVLVAVLRLTATPTPQSPRGGLDTRIQDVTLRFDPGEAEPVAAAPAVEPPPAPPPAPVEPPRPAEPTASQPRRAGTPHAHAIPAPLPAAVLAIIRKPRPGVADPSVKPAGATSPPARPIHGAMPPRQAVVYVLDGSGSMGEFGKLAAARDALVATLRRQPETVRFQILLYNSTARPLLTGGLVPATAANVAAAEAALARAEPAGRSNHAEAVRAAAGLSPDAVLVLTDAPDLPAVKVAGKPVPVWVARVTAAGVEPPKELR